MNNIRKEAYQLSGDRPLGGLTGVNMTDSALVKPVIYYQGRGGMERFLTFDVYATTPGQPMFINIKCPLCQARHPNNDWSLDIKQENKKFHLDVNGIPKFPGWTSQELVRDLGLSSIQDLKGLLTIEEPIKCTWETEPDLKRGFGMSTCEWRVKITDNIARDV